MAKKIKNTGDYNEAIMDFGGSICLPRKPKCTDCIFKLDCFANKNHLVEALPTKKQKFKIKTTFLIYYQDPLKIFLKIKTIACPSN